MAPSSTNRVTIGHSHGFHDGAMAIIRNNGTVAFAQQTERRTGIKHDKSKHPGVDPGWTKVLKSKTAFYERPRWRQLRQWWTDEPIRPKAHGYDHYVTHHWAHAAAAYYTRPAHWNQEPVCVVVDSIGEWDTASIWYKGKRQWSEKYPSSLGLFYSAVTQHLGYIPNRDEHLTMAMAGYARGEYSEKFYKWFEEMGEAQTNFHKGLPAIPNVYKDDTMNPFMLANTAQRYLEVQLKGIFEIARLYSPVVCYGGGVALNCVANTKLRKMFYDMWIFPNPGDAGAAFGAAAAVLKKRINMTSNYWGETINRNPNPKDIVNSILENGVVGVANGRDEFGPRALGNRSLLGDPRGDPAADKIYEIKQRQAWSPLAPAVLEEYFADYFYGPRDKYMSYAVKINDGADHLKRMGHVDGTARVQVVGTDSPSILRPILVEWYERTGCPILLNTSMNDKGKPFVSNWIEAKEFGKKHAIPVF